MKTEVLIIHPHKHHLLHFAAGAVQSGRQTICVTPFYKKGLGALVAKLSGKIGAKAQGYWHPGLPSDAVLSPAYWQFQKLTGFLNHTDLTANFDAWAARNIRSGAWRAKVVVTVQDYLPATTLAAKEAGCIVVSD